MSGPTEQLTRSPAQRRADALVELARRANARPPRALAERGRGRACVFEAAASSATPPAEDCEVDPFAEGGPTVVDNGRLACGFHHRSRPEASRPDRPQAPGEADEDERGPP